MIHFYQLLRLLSSPLILLSLVDGKILSHRPGTSDLEARHLVKPYYGDTHLVRRRAEERDIVVEIPIEDLQRLLDQINVLQAQVNGMLSEQASRATANQLHTQPAPQSLATRSLTTQYLETQYLTTQSLTTQSLTTQSQAQSSRHPETSAHPTTRPQLEATPSEIPLWDSSNPSRAQDADIDNSAQTTPETSSAKQPKETSANGSGQQHSRTALTGQPKNQSELPPEDSSEDTSAPLLGGQFIENPTTLAKQVSKTLSTELPAETQKNTLQETSKDTAEDTAKDTSEDPTEGASAKTGTSLETSSRVSSISVSAGFDNTAALVSRPPSISQGTDDTTSAGFPTSLQTQSTVTEAEESSVTELGWLSSTTPSPPASDREGVLQTPTQTIPVSSARISSPVESAHDDVTVLGTTVLDTTILNTPVLGTTVLETSQPPRTLVLTRTFTRVSTTTITSMHTEIAFLAPVGEALNGITSSPAGNETAVKDDDDTDQQSTLQDRELTTAGRASLDEDSQRLHTDTSLRLLPETNTTVGITPPSSFKTLSRPTSSVAEGALRL